MKVMPPSSDDHLAGRGPVADLERRFADYYALPFACATSSDTAALEGLVLSLGLGPGDEIITSPFTWGGSLVPFLHRGVTIVFVDIHPRTLALDPTRIAGTLSSRTRALLAVDPLGIPHDMNACRTIADNHDLVYIADAASSFGATFQGRPASSLADALVISLGPQKPLSVGEGGMILTRRRDIYERFILLTQHPLRQERALGLPMPNTFVLNARIHPMAAREALKRFDGVSARIQQRARIYDEIRENLSEVDDLYLPDFADLGITPSYAVLWGFWQSTPRWHLLAERLEPFGMVPSPPTWHNLASDPYLFALFPDQVRIPAPLTHAASLADRLFFMRAPRRQHERPPHAD